MSQSVQCNDSLTQHLDGDLTRTLPRRLLDIQLETHYALMVQYQHDMYVCMRVSFCVFLCVCVLKRQRSEHTCTYFACSASNAA